MVWLKEKKKWILLKLSKYAIKDLFCPTVLLCAGGAHGRGPPDGGRVCRRLGWLAGNVSQLFCSSLAEELRHGLSRPSTASAPHIVAWLRAEKIEVDDTVECILHSVLSEILRS